MVGYYWEQREVGSACSVSCILVCYILQETDVSRGTAAELQNDVLYNPEGQLYQCQSGEELKGL